ncbi:hypothetical protein HD597_000563 [Nonomuraea thailandensis]|uniref:Uncharacterized protein n=1 Tax=Nonomuraea thailandensis TaxID=1188745 RepID=A0A9X2JY91_9ACTN|nr:hypothetical protein [Nonomuraea thailandensis]MCP2353543.1 hypothetical protein [Nonomuraea thailandensis]
MSRDPALSGVRRLRWRLAAVSLTLATPTAVHLTMGLSWVWTPSMPLPLLRAVTAAGLLDAWLLVDLLTASGVLGAAAVAMLAAKERGLGVLVIAGVSAASLTAALSGGGWLPATYGLAYAASAAIMARR